MRKLKKWRFLCRHCDCLLFNYKIGVGVCVSSFRKPSTNSLYDLEKVQKRALSIIYPSHSYENALIMAGIYTLNLRRKAACKRFVAKINQDNPLYAVIDNRFVTSNCTHSLRSGKMERAMITRTDRFKNFVTAKYANRLNS